MASNKLAQSCLLACLSALAYGAEAADEPPPRPETGLHGAADKRGLARPPAESAAPAPAPISIPAAADEPPANPLPRPETGLHGAAVNQAVALPDGRLLTVSDDKTARLWPATAMGESQVLRVPIGKGNEGALYAAAFSPVKNKVAVAGWTGLDWGDHSGAVYVFDLASGKLTGRIAGIRGTIRALAYSDNSRYLAIGSESGWLRVVDLEGKAIALDGAACQKDALVAAHFLKDGRLLTACLDGQLRLYDAGFHPQAEYRFPPRHQPWRLAVSPQEDRVAVGSLDGPSVGIFSLADLRLLDTLKGEGRQQGNLSVVAWAGESIFAAGTYGNAQGVKSLRIWNTATHQARELSLAGDTVTDLTALPDGKLAYATAEPTVGFVNPANLEITAHKRATADFRDAFVGTFALSDDGKVVDFGLLSKGRAPWRFDLDARTLSRDPPPRPAMRKPVIPRALNNWHNSSHTTLGTQPIALDQNETSRSAAASADGGSILIGADFSLQLWRARQMAWNIAVPSPAWAVNLSGNGRFALAALGDGSLRWYDSKDGKELLALLALTDGRWLAWTPDGYFDHAEKAANLIGYHINQGKAASPQFVLSGQIHERFYRPDLIGMAITGTTGGNPAPTKPIDVGTVVSQHKAPDVKLLAWCVSGQCTDVPADSGSLKALDVNTEEVTLRFGLTDRGSGIGNLVVRRNAAAVATRGLSRVPSAKTAGGAQIVEQTVGLEPGDNVVTVTAFDAEQTLDAGEAVRLPIRYTATQPDAPNLYLLSIGINHYQGHPLRNAVNDANAISAALAKNPHHTFNHVYPTTLVDEQASLANIKQALAEVAKLAKPKDLVALFLAGHGINLDGRFYFLPQDVNLSSDASLKASSLSQTSLSESIAAMSATRVAVAIDACYAGAFAVQDSIKPQQGRSVAGSLAENTGRFVLAGTSNAEEALDGINGHGVFTAVLLEGLAGRADKEVEGNNNQHVSIVELQQYAQKRVPEEARKIAAAHNQNATGFYAGSEFFNLSDSDP